jgi:uncharacterized protein
MKAKYILLFFFLTGKIAFALDLPDKPNKLVNDYTNTLSSSEQAQLESKLVAFDDSTSTQVTVVIVPNTQGDDIADYAVQLFNKWHIGQKEKNNGVMLVVAKDDHRVNITTGFGVEGVLPDIVCNHIIQNDIVPEFRNNNYFEGIDAGTTSIMKIVSGEFTGAAYVQKHKEKPVYFPFAMFLFIVFIIFISRIGRVSRYARRNNLGWWAAWALLNAATNRSRGSWGGFTGGGSSWGGGGGFGGFGGGSSGGGGASGSW